LILYYYKEQFLDHSSTLSNIIYLDKDSNMIKSSNNVDFNKLFIDLSIPQANR